MRKWIAVLLGITLLSGLAGCATVQKKFTRKKKETRIPSVVYLDEGPYQKKFSNEYYYKTHFSMWRAWQDELLIQLGGNRKKVARCAEEALSHLTEMSKYLVPEKQAELKPQLDALAQIENQMDEGRYAESQKGSIRTELDKIKRIVSSNFYYDKVKDQIVPDTVDLKA